MDDGCNIPLLDEGISYTEVSAGSFHTVLLRSGGTAVACGRNDDGRCNIPLLDEGISYTEVSAGSFHTVLLRSDGTAVACGRNDDGRCNIPLLDEGISYTEVSAGSFHTVLLRSDGTAVACGLNDDGQCNIPSLKSLREFLPFASASRRYIRHHGQRANDPIRALQLDFVCEAGVFMLTCTSLAGHEVLTFAAKGSDPASDIHKEIAQKLHATVHSVQVVLSDGQLLASIYQTTPSTTLLDLSETRKRRRIT